MARIPLAKPDVAILDVRLQEGSGIEVCRDIRSVMPELICLMLTSYADDEAMYAAIMAGAAGYVLKQINARDLIEDVKGRPRCVAHGPTGRGDGGERMPTHPSRILSSAPLAPRNSACWI